MDSPVSTPSLLVLRRVTRAVAEAVRAQMTEHLATLAPLLRPKMVLGDYVEGGGKESPRRAEKAFKELQTLYEQVAATKPYALPRELTSPLRIPDTGLEITPVDYQYEIQTGTSARTIKVRSPLTWTLSYSGFGPARLPDLLKAKLRTGDELSQFVLSNLALHVVTTNSPGLMQVFEALHFPITSTVVAESGPLPMTRIGIGIGTSRPSDDVILETAELTGVDAFEEVINLDELSKLPDPLKERLLQISQQHVPG